MCGIVAEDDLILRIYEKNVRAVAIEIVYDGDLGNAIHIQIDDDAGRGILPVHVPDHAQNPTAAAAGIRADPGNRFQGRGVLGQRKEVLFGLHIGELRKAKDDAVMRANGDGADVRLHNQGILQIGGGFLECGGRNLSAVEHFNDAGLQACLHGGGFPGLNYPLQGGSREFCAHLCLLCESGMLQKAPLNQQKSAQRPQKEERKRAAQRPEELSWPEFRRIG